MGVTNYLTLNGRIRGETTNGIRTNYLTDALGSVTGTVNAGGQLQNRYRYKPSGARLYKSGNAPDPRFGWNGNSGYLSTTQANSSHYVRARPYDSSTGRWTAVDILWPQSPAYTYSLGNPTTLFDPSGLRTSSQAARAALALSPCAQFGNSWLFRWDLPWTDFPIRTPANLKWPPKTEAEFRCWEWVLSRTVNKDTCSKLSSEMGRFMTALQGVMTIKSAQKARTTNDDKYYHCLIGCHATEILGFLCAQYLAVWLEVKQVPLIRRLRGNRDPLDVVATTVGIGCASKPISPTVRRSSIERAPSKRCMDCCDKWYQLVWAGDGREFSVVQCEPKESGKFVKAPTPF